MNLITLKDTKLADMHRRPPFRLDRRGPGYYLIDASGQNVAQMTADKTAAEFICRACNSFRPLLGACKAALRMNTEETGSGGEYARKMDAVDGQLRVAIAAATGSSSIRLPMYGIQINIHEGAGRITSSDLCDENASSEYRAAASSLLGVVLAHACAGIDVESPAYLEGVETAVEAMFNEHGDQPTLGEINQPLPGHITH